MPFRFLESMTTNIKAEPQPVVKSDLEIKIPESSHHYISLVPQQQAAMLRGRDFLSQEILNYA